jgi:hypothetical protein
MTGACWEATPDGRPGWLTVFLRARLPVDVLDNVERGRAGWCCLPDVWDGEPVGPPLHVTAAAITTSGSYS